MPHKKEALSRLIDEFICFVAVNISEYSKTHDGAGAKHMKVRVKVALDQ